MKRVHNGRVGPKGIGNKIFNIGEERRTVIHEIREKDEIKRKSVYGGRL